MASVPIDALGNPLQAPANPNRPKTSPLGTPLPTPTGPAPTPLSPSQLPKTFGQDIHTTKSNPSSEDPNDPTNAPAGQQAAAGLKQWQSQLPGFLENQVGGAEDSARLKLAQDIQNTKASANSRGLLYSGVEAGNENMAKAEDSAQLASNIQDVNQGAQDITSQKFALAQQEANEEDANTLAMQQQQVDQSQNAYMLAMQEMQNQSSWYSQLFSGIGTIAGTVGGALVGGPAGAVAGGTIGSKL